MYKWGCFSTLCLVLCVFLCGCMLMGKSVSSSYAGKLISGGGGKGVYTDDAKIATEVDNVSASALRSKTGSSGGGASAEVSFTRFHGKKQYLRAQLAAPETHRVSYSLKTDKGSLKLVLVYEDGAVREIAEARAGEPVDGAWSGGLPAGETRLVLVGDEAGDGEAVFSLDSGGEQME